MQYYLLQSNSKNEFIIKGIKQKVNSNSSFYQIGDQSF